MNNDKTLYAVDQLLDTVNELRKERDEARKEAADWRNVALLDPILTPSQFKKAVEENYFDWEIT